MPNRRRTRYLVGSAIVLAGCVLASALAWFHALPSYRPALQDGERFGIDVSNHQHEIDWERVAGDDIAFAYIKATEGGDWVDPRFRENWDGAARAGIERGAYHFFTLCRPGHEQADNFLRTVPADAGALPPAVDLEFGPGCNRRPTGADVRHELAAFLDRVESATGQRAILYVLEDFDEQFAITDHVDRARWTRSLFRRPDGQPLIWQVDGRAHVDGITGDVDLDVGSLGA